VDIDDPAQAAARAEILAAATEEATRAAVADPAARAAGVVQGRLSLAHVNAVLKARGKPLLDAPADPGRGLAFVHLGKRAWFTALGARYVVVKEVFEIYAALLFARTGGASERAYGQAQEDWLAAALASPRDRGWTVLASSVSMSKLVLDLRGKPGVPPELQGQFIFTADQWDGLPAKKAQLLAQLKAAGRTLVVAGDIHAAYASVEGGVPCLTTPAISSTTASEVAAGAVAGYGLDPNNPSLALLVLALDGLFQEGNPQLVLSDTKSHGLVVLEVDADGATATYQLIPATLAPTSYATRGAELRMKVKDRVFQIRPGAITPA
jgi:alkaline phosphatase D